MSSRLPAAALLLLLMLSFHLPGSRAQEASGGIVVVVSQMGAIIEEFTVFPPQALPGEEVGFQVRVRNCGELPFVISGTSRVEISLRGTTVAILYFFPPGENILPNGEVDLTVTWTVDNLPPDNYSATAIIDYDGYSTSSSRTISILPLPPEVPPEAVIEAEAVETAASPPAWPGNPAVFRYSTVVLEGMEVRVTGMVGESTATVYQFSTLPTSLPSAIPAIPYKYMAIAVAGIPENAVEGATLTFRVEKSWMDSNLVDKMSIRLYRYAGGVWSALPTSVVGENETHVLFSAESPGFSYFGIGGLALPEEEYLAWGRRPVLVELVQGESRFLDVRLVNRWSSQLSGISVDLSGSAAGMATVVPGSFSLAPLEDVNMVLVLSVPGGTPPADYWLRMRAASGSALADAVVLVRVRPSREDGPVVTRTVELDMGNARTVISLITVNSRRALDSLEIVENIPKWLARDAGEIVSEHGPEVLEGDPLLRWTMKDLQPYERRVISYYVRRVPDEVLPLLYWSPRRISVVYHTRVELIRVLQIYSESMVLGGTGRIHVCLRNVDENTIAVRLRLELPLGWEALPTEILAAIAPGATSTFFFTVTNPPYAEPGVYMGELRLSYGGEEYVKGIAIMVSPSGSGILEAIIIFAGAIACVLIGLLLVRLMRGREGGKRALAILERVKSE